MAKPRVRVGQHKNITWGRSEYSKEERAGAICPFRHKYKYGKLDIV